jgi:hypothetical protein
MNGDITQIIQTAVIHWSQEKYHTDDILIADISPDEDEPERYLVILAARPLAYWLVVEVWFNDGQVETINDLGEGLPLEERPWPWGE